MHKKKIKIFSINLFYIEFFIDITGLLPIVQNTTGPLSINMNSRYQFQLMNRHSDGSTSKQGQYSFESSFVKNVKLNWNNKMEYIM